MPASLKTAPDLSKPANSPKRAVALDVLQRRWLRGAEKRDWRSALQVAARIVERSPGEATGWIWQAVSLHKLKRTAEARERLLVAAGHFPDMAIIYYHLACYTSQLGYFTESSRWWSKALQTGNKDLLIMMAANEKDLKPLWRSLGLEQWMDSMPV